MGRVIAYSAIFGPLAILSIAGLFWGWGGVAVVSGLMAMAGILFALVAAAEALAYELNGGDDG